MHPSTEINYGRQLVGIRFLADRQLCVQLGDEHPELCFKSCQIPGHSYRVHARIRADPYLDILKTWFAAKRTYKSRVEYVQALHDKCLPTFCRPQGWILALLRRLCNFLEDPSEILPQLLTVFVPIRHLEVLGSCFAQALLA